MLFSVLLGILIVAYGVYKWRRRHFDRCLKTLPADPVWPIIGNVIPFLKRPKDSYYVVKDLVAKYRDKGLCAITSGPFLSVLVWDPSFVETICSSSSTAWKGSFLKSITGDLYAGVVVQPGGESWNVLKKPLNKLFTKKQLTNEYHKIFVDKCKILTEFIKEKRLGKEYDVLGDCFHLVFDSMSETHMGVHSNEIKENKYSFLENVDEYMDAAVPSVLGDPFYAIQGRKRPGRTKRILEIIDKMHEVLQWVLDERRKIGITPHSTGVELYPDFLLRRGKEKNIKDKQLRKELIDVISAIESTGVLLSAAILYAGIFQDMQEGLLKEQKDIFGEDRMKEPTPEDLDRMEFLDRFIQESLRHVSPAGTNRLVHKDIQLGPYTLPKGALITVSAQGLHTDPRHWERPHEFHPDHFLPEKVAARPDVSFIPFGLGNRTCSGWKYSLIEVSIAMSFLIRNFKITTTQTYDKVRYKHGIMRQIEGDVPVKFELRN